MRCERRSGGIDQARRPTREARRPHRSQRSRRRPVGFLCDLRELRGPCDVAVARAVRNSIRVPMTDEQQSAEQKESEQIRQRRANFEELQKLGVPAYPHAFERTHTVSALVDRYGAATADVLEAEKVQTRTAGRVLAIRSFGKANFLAISDGKSRIQVYVRK